MKEIVKTDSIVLDREIYPRIRERSVNVGFGNVWRVTL